ncbi:MAG: hypothetical protein ACR2GY_08135 [Phycisphaerales bacterium]
MQQCAFTQLWLSPIGFLSLRDVLLNKDRWDLNDVAPLSQADIERLWPDLIRHERAMVAALEDLEHKAERLMQRFVAQMNDMGYTRTPVPGSVSDAALEVYWNTALATFREARTDVRDAARKLTEMQVEDALAMSRKLDVNSRDRFLTLLFRAGSGGLPYDTSRRQVDRVFAMALEDPQTGDADRSALEEAREAYLARWGLICERAFRETVEVLGRHVVLRERR